MPTIFTYPLSESATSSSSTSSSSSSTTSVSTRVTAVGKKPLLGRGIITPFVRDQKNDFANASDEANVRACVEQILGTECSSEDGSIGGELPWNSKFGCQWYLVRHRANDENLREVAKVYISRALTRWEPRVRLREVVIQQVKTDKSRVNGPDTIVANVQYDIVIVNRAGNKVITTGVSQQVRLR